PNPIDPSHGAKDASARAARRPTGQILPAIERQLPGCVRQAGAVWGMIRALSNNFGGTIMKLALLVSTLLISAVLLAMPADSTVTYVDHEKVGKGGNLATAPDLSVSVNRRTGPGQVEVHDKETDTFYVLDGEATIVTGGTMVGGKVSRPNQQLGTSITGGETRHLAKGDVMVIPAGVPHWFKEVPKEINYYVVKVIKP